MTIEKPDPESVYLITFEQIDKLDQISNLLIDVAETLRAAGVITLDDRIGGSSICHVSAEVARLKAQELDCIAANCRHTGPLVEEEAGA